MRLVHSNLEMVKSTQRDADRKILGNEQLIAIDVEQVRAFTSLEDNRVAANATKRAGCAVYAPGHQCLRAGKFSFTVLK